MTYEPAAVAKHLQPEIGEALRSLATAFEALDSFTAAPLEGTLRSVAESVPIKAAALIHATRVAVTGRSASPGLFEMLELAGRERVVARLHHAIAMVASRFWKQPVVFARVERSDSHTAEKCIAHAR